MLPKGMSSNHCTESGTDVKDDSVFILVYEGRHQETVTVFKRLLDYIREGMFFLFEIFHTTGIAGSYWSHEE